MACGGGGGGGKQKTLKLPTIDGKTAERDGKGLVGEIFNTLGRGDKDSLFSVLEEELVVFGPGPSDGFANRTDALVALGRVIDAKAKRRLALRSNSLEVVPAPRGRSAWVVDVATIGGVPHAITAILVNTDDLWQVAAVNVAATPSTRTLHGELDRDAIVPPAATVKVDVVGVEAAGPAVEKFKKGLLDPEAWGADLASRSDAIVVGPASGEVTRGKKAIKKLWKKRVAARMRSALNGEIVGATTRGGELAWVTAPITRVAEGAPPMPLRVFAVFEKAGEDWTLIALHEAASVGEPGAGAPFKKVLPPAEPPPPEKTADKTEKPAKKKTKKKASSKKKKKKKKKTDDDG